MIQRRDRAGLLVLFLMPAVLVLIVSLVQNNVLETTGASGMRVLFVDEDSGFLAQKIRSRLGDIESLVLVDTLDSERLTAANARKRVASGEYQFGIVIPEGASRQLQELSRVLARETLRGENRQPSSEALESLPLYVFFDPTVQGIFRTAVTNSLNLVVLGIEVEEKARELTRAMNTALAGRGGGLMGGAVQFGEGEVSRIFSEENLVVISEQSSSSQSFWALPNAVQQNVPAWALFGMFFIVVPLSGALLRERQEGTLLRLRSLPVSYEIILAGKISAFACICLVQFTLILAVGTVLLPALGTPDLVIQGRLLSAYALALCAALAATGFGVLIGTLARSYEQASMFGAVSVVVMAALGGVMVPVYVMPPALQSISIVSPLFWGLDGFLEIFVRGGDLFSAAPRALSLLIFAAGCFGLSLYFFKRANTLSR